MKPVLSLNLSDVHLGHRRLDPEIMCHKLWAFIEPKLEGINLLVLEGDLFDTAVGFSDTASRYILGFLIKLLKKCEALDITVRLLLGTFSHDRRQIINVVAIHESLGLTNNLRYFDTVSVEYIEKFDMKVAYIPDNVPYESSEAVIADIYDKMEVMGWETLDYIYIHGYFDHVLPNTNHGVKVVFREDQFSFIDRFVVVGHVHQHSMRGKIIYNGSTERLAHNEEEAKGIVLIDDKVTEASITFIENTSATKFVTFDYSDKTSEENIIEDFRQSLEALPDKEVIYVRIIHPSGEIRQALGSYLKNNYPLVQYSHSKGSETKVNRNEEILIPKEKMSTGDITPHNLPELVYTYISTKNKDSTVLGRDDIEAMLYQLERDD